MSQSKRTPVSITDYLRRRGFEPPWYSAPSLKRWWLTSFAQPGFAQFWRTWNPPVGFLLHQLYRKLGGDQNRILACLGTFAVCGFFHDLVILVRRSPHTLDPEWTIRFLIYGILVLLTSPRPVQKVMRKLPTPVHVAVNATCLYVGFRSGSLIWDFLQIAV